MNRGLAASAPTATVLLALIPGAVVQSALFGSATVCNVGIALATVVVIESLIAQLRGLAPLKFVRDGSACITASLLALSLPPTVPVGVVIAGCIVGIGIGKHVFGGIGNNPFNPAMVGYAALLLSFPHLLAWPDPNAVDAMTGPTALDTLKHRGGLTVADTWTHARGFGALGGEHWEWVNAAYFAGGITLVALRVVDWRIPITLLATLGVLAAVTYDAGSSSSFGSPLFHYLSGGTMLGAFFIATDPITSPTSSRGRILFAMLVGATLFLMRTTSPFPDGIAFAVLLGNAAVPLIEHVAARRVRPDGPR